MFPNLIPFGSYVPRSNVRCVFTSFDAVQVGDDVELTVVRDPEALAKDPGTKKLAAVRCAPPFWTHMLLPGYSSRNVQS